MEEFLSSEGGPAQVYLRYNICSSILFHWKKQYNWGRFNNEPTEEGDLRDRIEKLEHN